MEYEGFYINLDRSTERRGEIETSLAQFGLKKNYSRFPAADGNTLGSPNGKLSPGQMGCFISHYLLLKKNLGRTTPFHVVEDDVIFCRFTAPAIRSVISDGALSHYDIIYADSFIPTSSLRYKKYKSLYDKSIRRDEVGRVLEADFNVIDVTSGEFATTASMIINPASIEKLHRFYGEELAKGPDVPIDIFIRSKALEGALKIGCLFPFVTSVRLHQMFHSTLGDEKLLLTALAGTIARHSFFVECDLNQCLKYISEHLEVSPQDLHLQVLMRVLGFSLDPRFEFS